jgi:hypothetical protein
VPKILLSTPTHWTQVVITDDLTVLKQTNMHFGQRGMLVDNLAGLPIMQLLQAAATRACTQVRGPGHCEKLQLPLLCCCYVLAIH